MQDSPIRLCFAADQVAETGAATAVARMNLTLPWPPSCLWPNAKRRSHWSKYAGPTKAYQKTCWALALAAGAARRNDPAPHLSLTFNPPDRRSRDLDGMLGAFKTGLDGIANALRVDDSAFSLSLRKGEIVKGGAVCVVVGVA